ncbi:STAS domain-containing protein [Mesobacillus harenae]|uniref:STAS domain-containing protein n=1 Tax=Mesobacillus harenae TaxID=2213203 RepID=UPI001580334A|nr:STAS domain-containing protein [Mesobacillus harenae]
MIEYSLIPLENHLVVNLYGDLDIDSTEVIEEELLPFVSNYKKVHFKFEEVPFVDSSGMGLLLNLVQTLSEKGIKVKILGIREEIMEVFELLQLPEILGDGIFV